MSNRLQSWSKEFQAASEQQREEEKPEHNSSTPERKRSDRVRHTVYLHKDISYKVKFEKLQTGDEISEIVNAACDFYFRYRDEIEGQTPETGT